MPSSRVCLVAFLLLAGCSSQSPADRARDAHLARVEQHLVAQPGRTIAAGHDSLAERLRYWGVPGVSVAVVNHGQIEWAKGYGSAEPGGAEMHARSLLRGASLSKVANAVAVMTLVQQGKLDLDKDVNAQLVSWKLPPTEVQGNRAITLRMLLSHSAGMGARFFGLGYPAAGPVPTLLDVLDGRGPATQPVRVVEPPGARYCYSGGAVAISQLMEQDVTHEPYPRFVRHAVFDPLGMADSTFEQELPLEWQGRAAPGFKEGKRVNGPERVYPAMSGAGLWTTPTDMARIVLEVQRAYAGRGRVLKPESVAEMLKPQVRSPPPQTAGVGVGVFVAGEGASRTFFHAGSFGGYSSYLVGRIEGGQGVVVMTNGTDAFDLIEEIVTTVAREYQWPDYHFLPPPRAPKGPATRP